jgi:hypothetical protein
MWCGVGVRGVYTSEVVGDQWGVEINGGVGGGGSGREAAAYGAPHPNPHPCLGGMAFAPPRSPWRHRSPHPLRPAQVFPVSAPAGGKAEEGVAEEEEGAGGPSPAAVREAAKGALSNLLGSMGYFYGSSQV